MRQFMFPLQCNWKKWIRIGVLRPSLMVQSHDPQAIESQTGCFQHSHDLYWRAFVLNLKWTSLGDLPQSVDGFGETHRGGRDVQRSEVRECTVPGFHHLV